MDIFYQMYFFLFLFILETDPEKVAMRNKIHKLNQDLQSVRGKILEVSITNVNDMVLDFLKLVNVLPLLAPTSQFHVLRIYHPNY